MMMRIEFGSRDEFVASLNKALEHHNSNTDALWEARIANNIPTLAMHVEYARMLAILMHMAESGVGTCWRAMMLEIAMDMVDELQSANKYRAAFAKKMLSRMYWHFSHLVKEAANDDSKM